MNAVRIQPLPGLREPKPRYRPSIALVTAACFGGLVLISVFGIFVLLRIIADQNTRLFSEKTNLALDRVIDQVKSEIRPVQDNMIFHAQLIEAKPRLLDNEDGVLDLIENVAGGLPIVIGVSLVRPNGRIAQVFRSADGRDRKILTEYPPDMRATLEDMWAQHHEVYWGKPVYAPWLDEILLSLRVPVTVNGKIKAWLIAFVRTVTLSKFLVQASTKLSAEGRANLNVTTFILHGHDRVLAHPQMIGGYPRLTPSTPLPEVSNFVDPPLAEIWSDGWADRPAGEIFGRGHYSSVGTRKFVYLYKEIKGFSTQKWLVGLYAPRSDISGPIEQAQQIALIGIVIAGLAVVAAIFLGRTLSYPLRRLANALAELSELEFSHAKALPEGAFKETQAAAQAFNAMIRGLSWFENYVPRRLVSRLTAHNGEGALQSETRTVTVMFTDIQGFSRMSEGMAAEEVAAFLDEHFDILTACIREAGGTIDKFIGDAVMAFWNAPDYQADHALRACRAALAIRHRIAEYNQRRRDRSEAPVQLRIGIHTGPAVVGNIGSSIRINYTLVGDTVNVANRIGSIAKMYMQPADDVAILISETTEAELPLDTSVSRQLLGEHVLRGRDQQVGVYLVD